MKSFTRDLIVWIEQNLDRKILLESVAARSGYSMWYLQRLFRNETGVSLATYIRQRRLTESAIRLRMTSTPVVRAAEQFGFANQQAFTRTFTRHFGEPPGRYREAEHWHFRGLQPSLLYFTRTVPEPRTAWVRPPEFSGATHKYLCPPESLDDALLHTAQRETGVKKVWRLFQEAGPTCFAQMYEPVASSGNIRFCLTFSRTPDDSGSTSDAQAGTCEKFLCFSFDGTPHELTQFQVQIYRQILPSRPEARRKGQDFFRMSEDTDYNLLSSRLCGHYYVPVMPDESGAGNAHQTVTQPAHVRQ